MLISLNKEEYSKAQLASKKYWSSNKPGHYGSGLKNTSDDPHRIERIGILGEIAVAKLLNLDYTKNTKYIDFGEPYDFKTKSGSLIDVKTSLKNRSPLYILSRGRNPQPASPADIFIAAGLVCEHIVDETAVIEIHGYQTREFILTLPIKLSPIRGATHYNFELEFSQLLPIDDLLAKN